MSIRIACSEKNIADDAVTELKNIFGATPLKMIVYFASSDFVPQEISATMQQVFAGATVFGCTTAGEIISGRMLKGAVVAMAFDEESISEVRVEVLENLSKMMAVNEAFCSFGKYFGESMDSMDPSQFFGIVLVDGLSGAEEQLMDTIGDKTNITFIGGSAADDLKFSSSHVYANGKAYSDAAVLAVLKPGTSFELIKTQSVSPLGARLVVTKANAEQREIVEFNRKPASVAYAEALGVPVSDLATCFPRHPLGLLIEGEPYVRSPREIAGDSVFFNCSSVDGMELTLLEASDLVGDTKAALDCVLEKLGSISGVVVFNCVYRAIELDKKNLADEYARLFADYPTIGFNCYGEQFIGHINQTATMIVFR